MKRELSCFIKSMPPSLVRDDCLQEAVIYWTRFIIASHCILRTLKLERWRSHRASIELRLQPAEAMNTRLIWAMLAFASLAALAGYTLGDASFIVGQRRVEMRVAVWILLGGFALKTLIAWGRYRAEASDDSEKHSD